MRETDAKVMSLVTDSQRLRADRYNYPTVSSYGKAEAVQCGWAANSYGKESRLLGKGWTNEAVPKQRPLSSPFPGRLRDKLSNPGSVMQMSDG